MSRSTSPHVVPEPRSERSWSARRDSFQRDFAGQKVVVRIERELYGASAAVLVERLPATAELVGFIWPRDVEG